MTFSPKSFKQFIWALGVFLQEGLGKRFWINLILTILGYVPGIIHALWITLKRYAGF